MSGDADGGPEEDPSDTFTHGGWQAPFPDPAVGEFVTELNSHASAFLFADHHAVLLKAAKLLGEHLPRDVGHELYEVAVASRPKQQVVHGDELPRGRVGPWPAFRPDS